jgi:hypothetical protein
MKPGHIKVQCDAKGCDWQREEHIDAAHRWHNAPCPKCGAAPIISGADMAVLTAMRAARALAPLFGLRVLVGDEQPGPGELRVVDVTLDTSNLRDADGSPKKKGAQ